MWFCSWTLSFTWWFGAATWQEGKRKPACRTRVWPMWTEMLVLKLANPNSTRRKSFLNMAGSDVDHDLIPSRLPRWDDPSVVWCRLPGLKLKDAVLVSVNPWFQAHHELSISIVVFSVTLSILFHRSLNCLWGEGGVCQLQGQSWIVDQLVSVGLSGLPQLLFMVLPSWHALGCVRWEKPDLGRHYGVTGIHYSMS